MGIEPRVRVFKACIPQVFRFLMLEFLRCSHFSSWNFSVWGSGFWSWNSSRGTPQQHVPSTWGVRILNGITHLWLHVHVSYIYIYIYIYIHVSIKFLVIPETLTTSKLSRSLRQLTFWVIWQKWWQWHNLEDLPKNKLNWLKSKQFITFLY